MTIITDYLMTVTTDYLMLRYNRLPHIPFTTDYLTSLLQQTTS